MKQRILIVAMVSVCCFIAQTINAQLKVESTGHVKFTKNLGIGANPTDNTGVYVGKTSVSTNTLTGVLSHVLTRDVSPTGNIWGIYSYADGWATTESAPNVSQIVAIYGKALGGSSSTNRFTAGVVGVANGTHSVGIFGTITSANYSLPTSWTLSSYAGYFAGNVKITGTLTVPTSATLSDARLKTDIQNIQSTAASKILDLHPVSYSYNLTDTMHFTYREDAKETKVRHYGLIAQEVQEIIPDVVYDADNGYLSINYTELIPLLIQTVQDQQKQINDLQKQVQKLQTK